jgi:hypothetical protein
MNPSNQNEHMYWKAVSNLMFFRPNNRAIRGFCFFLLFLSAGPSAFTAIRDPDYEPSPQEISQAQATMASLFGRGATMPAAPRMGGTIALPSFDSSEMEVSKKSLEEAQRRDLDAAMASEDERI